MKSEGQEGFSSLLQFIDLKLTYKVQALICANIGRLLVKLTSRSSQQFSKKKLTYMIYILPLEYKQQNMKYKFGQLTKKVNGI